MFSPAAAAVCVCCAATDGSWRRTSRSVLPASCSGLRLPAPVPPQAAQRCAPHTCSQTDHSPEIHGKIHP